MASMIMNIAMVYGLVQIANKFELDQPKNAPYLQISYGSVQLVTLLLIAFMYSRISSKKDEQKLVYAEKKPSFQNEDDQIIETTVMKYDLEQLKQLAIQTVMGAAIISVMYYKWGYLRPLLLQSVLGPKALISNPLIQIHIFGREALGTLKRPWKQPNPFGGDAPAELTPKEVKKAEKSGKKIVDKKTD